MSLSLIEVDDFISSLWNVHLSVKREGYVQVTYPAPCLKSIMVLIVNPRRCR